jgi:hypothetical protein
VQVSWIVPSPVSVKQGPETSVVLVVVEDALLVEVTVVVVAHDGRPSVQLHSPALQAEMIPFLHRRFALPFKPAHRALMDGLQLLRLQGLRAPTGVAEITKRASVRTNAANLL